MGGAVYRARSGYQEWLRVAKISCWLFNQREGGPGTVSVCEGGVFFLRRIVLRHIVTLFCDTLSCAECLVQSVLSTVVRYRRTVAILAPSPIRNRHKQDRNTKNRNRLGTDVLERM
jgi:hypothetical protein